MTTETQAGNGQDSEAASQQAAAKPVHNPHDKLARVLLGTAERAIALHNDFGPEATKGKIKAIRQKIGLFIDSDLSSSEADLLYEVEPESGKPPMYISLVEVKSYSDAFALLQLLGYLIRAWIKWAGGKAERARALPPAVLTLLHTGKEPWTESLSLRGAIPFFELFGDLVPEVILHLIDLAALPVERILQTIGDLAAGLLAMKFAGQKLSKQEIENEYARIFQQLPEETDLTGHLYSYVVDTNPEWARLTIAEVVRKERPKDWRYIMRTIGDAMRAEGVPQGMARTLTLVLESRFGTLPEEVLNSIGTADAPQLDRWATKAANAPTLDAVINGHDAS